MTDTKEGICKRLTIVQREPGKVAVVPLWYCGGMVRYQDCDKDDVEVPCFHPTASDAEACPRRPRA